MFIMFLILSMVVAGLFVYLAMKDYLTGAACTFVFAICLLFVTAIVHFDTVTVGKVEILKSIGMKPLPTSQVYEMSRKELDKCKKFYTFDKTYYFIVEER